VVDRIFCSQLGYAPARQGIFLQFILGMIAGCGSVSKSDFQADASEPVAMPPPAVIARFRTRRFTPVPGER
jgi:hypothetical protein